MAGPIRRFKDFFNPQAAVEGGWNYKHVPPTLTPAKRKELMDASSLESPRSTMRAITGVLTPYWTKAAVPERLMGAALLATSLAMTWYAVQITVEFGNWQSGLVNTTQQLFQTMIQSRPDIIADIVGQYGALQSVLEQDELLNQALMLYPDATQILRNPAFAELIGQTPGMAEMLQENPTLENLFLQFPSFQTALAENPNLMNELSSFRENITQDLLSRPDIQEHLDNLLSLAGGDFFKNTGNALSTSFNSVADAVRGGKMLEPLSEDAKEALKSAWYSRDLVTIALKFTAMSIIAYKSAQFLALRWRAWTTGYYTNKWLGAKAFSRIKNTFNNIDNPGQRMQEDPAKFTGATVSLMTGVMGAGMTLTAFFGMLWGLGPVLGVPGGFAWIGLAYAASLTALTVGVGYKLPWIQRQQQRREADLRKALDNVDNNADLIAQNSTEEIEKALIKKRFKPVMTNSLREISTQVRLIVVDATAGNVSIPIPYLAASFAGVAAGTASMGTIQTLNYAFNRVTSSLSFIVNRFDQITAWMATAQRMYMFDLAVDASYQIEKEKKEQGLALAGGDNDVTPISPKLT